MVWVINAIDFGMPARDPILSPEIIRILKIFIFSSLGMVIAFSFFDGYRADNSGRDRSFLVADANRIYFLNVRGIHYDREVRRDAGMTLFRHSKRIQTDSLPSFFPALILNPTKDEAYIYFELENAEYPIQILAQSGQKSEIVDFSNGNNADHFQLLTQLNSLLENDYSFQLRVGDSIFPLWAEEKELSVLKTVMEDYFRLLD
ncbi:MAG: hypothetical protein EP311_09445 [Cytophagales bacterium]|nr:MAG: hypothetical protein EP311_09445 [Cytophagales bacterium]